MYRFIRAARGRRLACPARHLAARLHSMILRKPQVDEPSFPQQQKFGAQSYYGYHNLRETNGKSRPFYKKLKSFAAS
jgi:hypothetical protein